MLTPSNPPASVPEDPDYDNDDVALIIREEDPDIEAKLDAIFAPPPPTDTDGLEDF
ncbi:hypothetical protein H6F88_32120 [Oculatella sp. FACHB-28]|uniref:hypothetical protein n=1 Tax=Oculatella sp. FACHB-28 TaxID=2692845 RepID=UPI001688A89E|nr:hypothetical protein [Oculatella sp. FACHB-28]MBD2060592.1 hypothetical protein [Oculatella sp. FACHB-28]